MTRRLRALGLAAALLALAQCTTPPPSSSPPPAQSRLDGQARVLEPFFNALAELEDGSADGPVVVVQLGDSHTAGDQFSGKIRERLQQRFGNAGRGMLPPGVPFDYYRPTGVEVTQTDGWRIANSFDRDDAGIFGLSGFRAETGRAGAAMVLTATGDAGFDRAAVDILRQPAGGALIARIDDGPPTRIETAGTGTGWIDIPTPPDSRTLTLETAGDGPVSLLGWSVGRSRPGVVLDSHGIVGATVNVVGRWSREAVTADLAARNPDLVILVYGTNEGFNDGLDPAAYQRDFAARLDFLKRAAPGAAFLVVGPPDGNRLPEGCAREGQPFSCTPEAAAGSCAWSPPPMLDEVRAIQRQAALEQRAYYWDWSQVMGGVCGTHRWTRLDPPLTYGDHVHMTSAGYARSADALVDHLMMLYDRYRGEGDQMASR
ncbi:GDSL-type esterase/lipase family protein [Inquilinus sp. CAU 1745]|uniref:GDSL-type esterase/lipase family protein n=1 Tax=Inquilinus sp. CAU 1745 TaxID=3140369 RepID=UPI00325C08A8